MKNFWIFLFGLVCFGSFPIILLGQEVKENSKILRLEKIASQNRGLDFKRKVKVGAKTKKELKEYVLNMLAQEMPPKKMLAMKKTLEAFGLIRRSAKLRDILTHFYANIIAGFYHPGSKKLYVIRNRGEISGGPQGDAAIIHELIHALQDQNFDLFTLQKYVQTNSDRSAALSALVEGDATLGMFANQMRGSKEGQKLFVQIYKISVDISKEFMAVNRNVPTFIQDSIFFNYTQGLEFNWRLKQAGGITKINQAFRDLPASTEQILHPEKYLSSQRDEPWTIQLPKLNHFFSPQEGWVKLSEDTMGELGIQILLNEYLAYRRLQKQLGVLWKKISSYTILRGISRLAYKFLNRKAVLEAAAGWGGDGYQVYYNPKTQKTALVWLTYWDTKKDARQFYHIMYTVRRLAGQSFPLHPYQKGKKVLILTHFPGNPLESTSLPRQRQRLVTYLWQNTKIIPFNRHAFAREFPLCQTIYRLRFEKDKAKLKIWEKKILSFGKSAIPFLIQALDGETKKSFLTSLGKILEKMTGQKLGTNYEKWKKWQEKQKK